MEEMENWSPVEDRRRVVRHMTKMLTGKYKDSCVMGVESPEVIESYEITSQREENNSWAS